MLTTKSPKGHKLRLPKKSWIKFYEPDVMNFDGIIKKIDGLVPNHQKIVALSGGKDSSCVLHKLYEKNMVDRAFFIRTNIGVQETEDFVIELCESYKIPLDIREPAPFAYIYPAVCLEIGFPVLELHAMIMRLLKYQAIIKYVTEPQFKQKPCVLMSGVRKYESERRKFNYDQPINLDTNKIWFACPVFYETTPDIYRYFIENNLKKSTVYEWANTSLECACGSFAQPEHLELIKKHAPKLYDYIMWIKDGIERFGSDHAKQWSDWGDLKPRDDAQQILEKFFGDNIEHQMAVEKMVCGSECGAGTMRAIVDI